MFQLYSRNDNSLADYMIVIIERSIFSDDNLSLLGY